MNRIYEILVSRLAVPTGDGELPLVDIVTFATAPDGKEALEVARSLLVEWTSAGAMFKIGREIEVKFDAYVCYVGDGAARAVAIVDAEVASDVAACLARDYGGHPLLGYHIRNGDFEVACKIERDKKGIWE